MPIGGNIKAMNKPVSPARKSARVRHSTQRGVALLEALVSILLFSMGVLALVGLQSTMIKNTSDAQYRSEASYIAQQWVGVMWSNPDPGNLPLYAINSSDPRYNISNLLPNGTRTVAVSGIQATITINWMPPGNTTPHQLITIANIVAP
jgi:type IV pilus assembly protein PilV